MKQYLLILIISISHSINAYDICNPRFAFNSIAKSKCFKINQQLDQSSKETFTLAAVQLTENLETLDDRDNIILIPGGPGGDSQGLALSLNQKSILDALWRHLNLNVALFDPRGTGNSELNKSAELYDQAIFSTSNQVKDLQKVINTVSPHKPVYLFAHSAGGNTAAKYAALNPNRVKGLILYSASIDTREIGKSNLRIFSKEFEYFKNYLSNKCSVDNQLSFSTMQYSIEEFLRGVIKLQRLSKIRPTELQGGFYLKDFRVEMISSIENDFNCNSRVKVTLDKWNKKIEKLPNEVKELVSDAMNLSYDVTAHRPPQIKRGTWIKTAVICSEGLTVKEHVSELWLDGLNFEHDTCFNTNPIYNNPPSRDWLALIKSPTLLIGGTEDPYQIPSAVRRNAKAINNSTILMLKDAGHEPHLTHPIDIFNAIKLFIK